MLCIFVVELKWCFVTFFIFDEIEEKKSFFERKRICIPNVYEIRPKNNSRAKILCLTGYICSSCQLFWMRNGSVN